MTGVTILLAEDEPSLRWVFAEALKSAGFDVLEAGDGAEALALAGGGARPIALLFSDVPMPRLGGFELARRLRLARPGLKVLFLSGAVEDAPAGDPLLA